MRVCSRIGTVMTFPVGVLATNAPVTLLAQDNSTAQAREGIERLHQQDVRATLSGKAADFAQLWDREAVRIQPGSPVEIGQPAIYATDKHEEANANGGRAVCYTAEMKDLQISGDSAFEWGYFSYKDSATSKPGRGKVLRVIKR